MKTFLEKNTMYFGIRDVSEILSIITKISSYKSLTVSYCDFRSRQLLILVLFIHIIKSHKSTFKINYDYNLQKYQKLEKYTIYKFL